MSRPYKVYFCLCYILNNVLVFYQKIEVFALYVGYVVTKLSDKQNTN